MPVLPRAAARSTTMLLLVERSNVPVPFSRRSRTKSAWLCVMPPTLMSSTAPMRLLGPALMPSTPFTLPIASAWPPLSRMSVSKPPSNAASVSTLFDVLVQAEQRCRCSRYWSCRAAGSMCHVERRWLWLMLGISVNAAVASSPPSTCRRRCRSAGEPHGHYDVERDRAAADIRRDRADAARIRR